MTLGEKLRKARDARGLTLEAVGQRMGVTRKAVSQWETDVTVPRTQRLNDLAALYQVDINWLLSGNDSGATAYELAEPTRQQRGVPVISYVQAGEWTDVNEHAAPTDGERIYTELPVGARTFALIVEGLSMSPDILPGDKVIVDPDVSPYPGCVVVAQIDGDARATLKRYRDRGRDETGLPIIELAPANPDYPTLRIDAANPGRIVGVMVERRSYPAPRLPD